MRSLENRSMINDLHIKNSSKSLPPEYPQYNELTEQTEFRQQDEWAPVLEDGSPDTSRSPAKKPSSEKAVTMAMTLKKLLAAVALIAAVAIIMPGIVPAIDLGSPVLETLYISSYDNYIIISASIEAREYGDELRVVVYNDFVRYEAKHTLGDFTNEYNSHNTGVAISEFDSSSYDFETDPHIHYVYADATGLKIGMKYKIQIICSGKTLYTGSIYAGSERDIVIGSSSSSH